MSSTETSVPENISLPVKSAETMPGSKPSGGSHSHLLTTPGRYQLRSPPFFLTVSSVVVVVESVILIAPHGFVIEKPLPPALKIKSLPVPTCWIVILLPFFPFQPSGTIFPLCTFFI